MIRMKLPRIAAILLTFVAAFASHAGPIEPGSPRAALKEYNDALPAGGVKAALAAYHIAGDKEKPYADSLAKADLAMARLEKLTREKFGDKAVDNLDHAMRTPSETDLLAATEKIEGDEATIKWPNEYTDLEMIKVDGKWKVSVKGLYEKDEELANLIKTTDEMTQAAAELTRRLSAGDYANEYLFIRAVKQRWYRILGDEDSED